MRNRGWWLAAVILLLASPWAQAVSPGKEPAPGDPRRGQALYAGSEAFVNGGAPCLACHGIAGLGPAGGAGYGPDLTAMFADYGAEGVASILEALPFPSMEPIYASRPLTAGEQADLAAFLKEAAGGRPPRISGVLALETAAGAAVLLAAAFVFGRRRLRAVRRPLVERAAKGKGEGR